MSCAKEQESEALDQDLMKPSIHFNPVEITHAVSWDQLPESIRNAEILDPEHSLIDPSIPTEDLQVSSRSDCMTIVEAEGPCISNEGTPFFMIPESGCHRIYAVLVNATDRIKAIAMVYERENGSLYIPTVAGPISGQWYYHFLEQEEVIIGTYVGYDSILRDMVRNIRFWTVGGASNYIEYGQISTGLCKFWSSPGDIILGFHGREGEQINAVGTFNYGE